MGLFRLRTLRGLQLPNSGKKVKPDSSEEKKQEVISTSCNMRYSGYEKKSP